MSRRGGQKILRLSHSSKVKTLGLQRNLAFHQVT